MSTSRVRIPPTVRTVPAERHRDAAEVFGAAFLVGPVNNQMWERSAETYADSVVQGIVEDDGSIGGIARSFDVTLAVPGGSISAAAVTSVGVRADRRRRGYLRALMEQQLTEARKRGAVVAALRATEASIYARFGYGVASSYGTVTVNRRRAVLRKGAAADRSLRMITPAEVVTELPAVYERIRTARPGTIARPAWWWASQTEHYLHRDQPVWVICTVDDQGEIDGFLIYTTVDREHWSDPRRAVIKVLDMRAIDEKVELALWEATFGLDLSEYIEAPHRPLDTVLPLALTDPRAAVLSAVEDETWIRMLDVPQALAARTFGQSDPVILGITDEIMPDNSGSYCLSHDGAERTDATAELECGVGELAAAYLGGTRFAALAAAGRVAGATEALSRADMLFATLQRPWCGTYY